MKHLCCSKLFLLFFFSFTLLFAHTQNKSAIVYYGNKISYPMVGIHNYIIVEPSHTNVYTHGFKVYNKHIYAYVSIGEIDRDNSVYKDINSSWILGRNKAWKSDVLDITNPQYQKFLFSHIIEPQIKRGFHNFFFDTLDSYELVSKTPQQREAAKKALIHIIKTFHTRYPKAKLIINRGFEIIDAVHSDIEALLFESYFQAYDTKKNRYDDVNEKERAWLNKKLAKVKKYKLDIIALDYLPFEELHSQKAEILTKKLTKEGFIPYISTKNLDIYGVSTKKAIKREILTIVDTSTTDKMQTGAHLYGAVPLEYMGYIQSLYDIHQPLPSIQQMQQYAGVVIWLSRSAQNPQKLISWLTQVKKAGIPIVFAGSFGINNLKLLNSFGITSQTFAPPPNNKNSVLVKKPIMGYEMNPPLFYSGNYIKLDRGKILYKIADKNAHSSVLAALTPWGGFAIDNAFMTTIADDNIWTINPFLFFKEALHLQEIPVPDTTTQNAKRILFSHIDGDAIMNRVEWNPKLFCGEIIYKDILKKYPLPISASIVGAEVDDNGLYPKLAPQLQKIVKNIYKLPNVEPATHTFSHPFAWEEIKNNTLSPKYRLDPKGYTFSLNYEIEGMLQQINKKYLPKNKFPKAKTIFWSGDCMPQLNALSYVYKHHILNINGGDTYITNRHPWLSYIAPIGLGRGEYYQIYTGAQNENVYTHDWHGPYWGFRNVIQTFKLTDTPRRLKPMDIYYHYYSGSKRASLNALTYVYDWAMKQDTTPLFTSEYIPKAMDYYSVSLSKAKTGFFIAGVKNLKTLRIDHADRAIDFNGSTNVAGYKAIGDHTYINIAQKDHAFLQTLPAVKKETTPYLVSANGTIIQLQQTQKHLHLELQSHLPLKLQLYIPAGCHYKLTSGYKKNSDKENILSFSYKTKKRVSIDAICK